MSLVTDDGKGAAAPAAGAEGDKGAAAPAAGATVTVDDQRKFLTDAGGKADEISKLSEADLKAKYDAAKTAADAKAKETAKQGAPADGKYTFTAPEGMTLDAELTVEVSAWAKEHNIPQASAQKIVDMGVKIVQKQQAALTGAIEKANIEWTEKSRADKEFGGANLDQNLAVAKKAMEAFATSEFKTLLKETGLGNHPEMIRTLYRVGKAISEDKLVTGKTGASAGERSGTFSYPNSQHAK